MRWRRKRGLRGRQFRDGVDHDDRSDDGEAARNETDGLRMLSLWAGLVLQLVSLLRSGVYLCMCGGMDALAVLDWAMR